jgi:glucokinase
MTAARAPVLALDIGGTKLAAAVVTDDGRTHGFVAEPTRADQGPGAVLRRLWDLGRAAIAGAGLGDVGGVGISCGGPLNATAGILLNPLHLPGWHDIPIVALADDQFGVPAVLGNDASAAALAEFRFGAGRGTSTMLYLTVSTGIGGGAVINGIPHRGAAGNGGEFGHILVKTDGRACLCGRFGCLEAYASGTSIAARTREALARHDGSSTLGGLAVVRAEDVSAAAQAGDPLAREVWDETLVLLASAITDLVNAFEPELVVLGGGVTRAGSALLDPVRRAVLRDAMGPVAAVVRLERAELGDAVGVVGAAALAFDRYGDRARGAAAVTGPVHASVGKGAHA